MIKVDCHVASARSSTVLLRILVLTLDLLMTSVGYQGWISIEDSVAGILGVLESGKDLNGRFISFDGTEIPW